MNNDIISLINFVGETTLNIEFDPMPNIDWQYTHFINKSFIYDDGTYKDQLYRINTEYDEPSLEYFSIFGRWTASQNPVSYFTKYEFLKLTK